MDEKFKSSFLGLAKGVYAFSGCHAHVVRSNPTVVSVSDILRLQTGIHNTVDMKDV